VLFERIMAEGLAHNSYLIASEGEAAVIDPRRDCGIYLDIAQSRGLTLRYIFETHRNEDYVSGSLALAECSGAEILHGRQMQFSFGKPVQEGDTFALGSLEINVRETPGHTEESISLVVTDRDVSGNPYMIFCGDTLFAGAIARTDFFGRERNSEMAQKIFDSITGKILPLGDGVIVCPAHGAGSICGGDIADHPFTTVGYERQTNPLLRMGRKAFIARRRDEFFYTPPYFRQMEKLNLEGAPRLPCDTFPKFLSADAVAAFQKALCQILDIRSPSSFSAGHIPGSISLWRDGIPAYTGWFLDYDNPIVIVDDFNLRIEEVIPRFHRLGYDMIGGILKGGFGTWAREGRETATLPTISPGELNKILESGQIFVLDVRHIDHWRTTGHIPSARHVYVGEIMAHLSEIPRDVPVVVYCDAGFKGSLAGSILLMNGYRNVSNLRGGLSAWKQAGFLTVP
jgi:hydroxyacylglutathione hydrolase